MDAHFKTLSVQNNITIRGAPLLVEGSHVNPVFLDNLPLESFISNGLESLKNEMKTLRAEVVSLKQTVYHISVLEAERAREANRPDSPGKGEQVNDKPSDKKKKSKRNN